MLALRRTFLCFNNQQFPILLPRQIIQLLALAIKKHCTKYERQYLGVVGTTGEIYC